jgi:hypothetical protein
MRKGLMVLVLAALLFPACADNSTNLYRSRDPMIDRARTCATCGASVRGDYFAGSAFKAIGPGSY